MRCARAPLGVVVVWFCVFVYRITCACLSVSLSNSVRLCLCVCICLSAYPLCDFVSCVFVSVSVSVSVCVYCLPRCLQFHLLRRLLGVKTEGEKSKVSRLKTGEILMANIGSTSTSATVCGGNVCVCMCELVCVDVRVPHCITYGWETD